MADHDENPIDDAPLSATQLANPLDIHHHHQSPENSIDNDGNVELSDEYRSHDFLETLMGVAGNVLEWYDFAVFGYFSDIIGDVFFPPQSGHSQTIESFAVFGLAFVMRPIGGLMMGYIGDVYGRKKALVISIFLMAFPTFAMGCLPSYDKVGNVAIVLLLLTRMLQGMSVGGQLVSSLVFTLENHDSSKWGWYGSFVMGAANFGTLLGNLIAFVIHSRLTDEQLSAYGWRIPFWSGILVSLSGFYLRSSSSGEESPGLELVNDHHQSTQSRQAPSSTELRPVEQMGEEDDDELESFHDENETEKGQTKQNPLKLAFAKENMRSLLSATMVPTLWAGGFYLSFVWMATYMRELSTHPIDSSFAVNAFSLLLSVCAFFPVAGYISDLLGRVRVMTVGGSMLGVLGPVMIYIIGLGNPFAAFGAQMILGIALSLWGAPMTAWLVECFDPAARLTSVATGYNLAQCIAGGTSPAIATLLADDVGVNAPGWLLTILAVIALVGLRFVAPATNYKNLAARSHASTETFHPVPTDGNNATATYKEDCGVAQQSEGEDELL